jgi:ketosteroid isomerase-like protein
MSDREAIIKANRDFYLAFERRDLEQMEKVWLSDPRIVCIHPGWRWLTGWGPVVTSWERIFESTFEIKLQLGELDVMISGDLAVVVVEENLTQHGYDGVMRGQTLATNVFERVGDRWFMVVHHGSQVIEPPGSEPRLQ